MNAENSTVTNVAVANVFGDPQTSGAALGSSHNGTGKIARLPLAVREQLNQRIQNGEPGRQLVEWLNSLPEVQAVLAAQFQGQPIGEMCLSRWRAGGHQIWLQEQRALAAVALLFEQSSGLQAAAKDGLTDRMTLVLTAKLALELQRLEKKSSASTDARSL